MERSASIVFDVMDAATGERHTVYRCNECKALVLGDDAREHLWWHDTPDAAPTTPAARTQPSNPAAEEAS